MTGKNDNINPDFKGIGYSKIGYFKETRSKIKELERLNLELARRHNKLEAVFNSISDGLTILDNDLNIVFANQVQKNMFLGEHLEGEKCYRVYYHKNHRCKDCPAVDAIRRQADLSGEVFIQKGEHSGRYYEWTTSPVQEPSGKVYEVILLMRDVTKRKEYEYKLMQADRMAAIGFLAAGIAHEINNPLASIAGFSEGLIKRLGKPETFTDKQRLRSCKEYLEIIYNEAYRCKDIIKNLQAFSNSSSDNFETRHVDTIIRDTVSLFRQRAKDHRVKITYNNHLVRGLDTIRGKESQLKHLFLNLFIRAFKSVEGGGELAIVSSNEGNQIKVALSEHSRDWSENGESFNAYHWGEIPGKEKDIDLSICYNIVQHHKGMIRYENSAQYGNVLTLYFPASA
jgi:two-component system, NtrC family, sensor kinase